MLQEFDLEIKDKRGAENLAADHLSRLENPDAEVMREKDINDSFPEEHLFSIRVMEENEPPWFADLANYLVGGVIPKWFTYQQRKKFFSDLKHYVWEDPYLFRVLIRLFEDVCLELRV